MRKKFIQGIQLKIAVISASKIVQCKLSKVYNNGIELLKTTKTCIYCARPAICTSYCSHTIMPNMNNIIMSNNKCTNSIFKDAMKNSIVKFNGRSV